MWYVLGDFVERSIVDGNRLGVVGLKCFDCAHYVSLEPRSTRLCIRIADERLRIVKGTHRVILHLKNDK